MANKFEFKQENRANLDICGKKYVVEMTAENIAASDEITAQFSAVGKEAQKLEGAESVIHMCTFCADSIDRLLGSGSTKEIFGDRAITLPDLIDLLLYIQNEIREVFEKAQARDGKAAKIKK